MSLILNSLYIAPSTHAFFFDSFGATASDFTVALKFLVEHPSHRFVELAWYVLVSFFICSINIDTYF